MCSFLDIICYNFFFFFSVKQNSCSWSSPKIPDRSFPATLLLGWRATKYAGAWAVAHWVGSGERGWEPSCSWDKLQWIQTKEAGLLHQMRDGETRIGLRLLQGFLWGMWRPEWIWVFLWGEWLCSGQNHILLSLLRQLSDKLWEACWPVPIP